VTQSTKPNDALSADAAFVLTALPADIWPRLAAELRHVRDQRLHGHVDIALFTVNGSVMNWSVGSGGKNSPSRGRTQVVS
jgi:hypothetical protein